ncbi:Sgn1p SCDLUD_005164 [Saccharomycodes ludwigii]|uniref:Sgn1p n=1 Tax=Saccharomycodes ludwigii TaxID=36035 RepID=UPI001E84EBE3|nr:hypothetical protein SCDLUD_005164 [Saccharomycodes ludwigii]KAH3898826.1 hypothetical protein SCDLUD_005164 [Saccharomycodes ludwigii]
MSVPTTNLLHTKSNLLNNNSDNTQAEIDKRSIFVKNLNVNTSVEQLESYFTTVGYINRITIFNTLKTKKTHLVNAYIEFDSLEAKEKALFLHGSNVNGHVLHIYEKRSNKPKYLLSIEEENNNSNPKQKSKCNPNHKKTTKTIFHVSSYMEKN